MDKYDYILIFLLIIALCMFAVFIKTYIDLDNYTKCDKNNFKDNYCIKYKDY